MSYINKTVTSNGTEADFIWAFIQSFKSDLETATGWTVSCELTSLQAVSDWIAATTTPDVFNTFSFTVNSIFTIVMTNGYYTTNRGRNCYNVKVAYNSQNGDNPAINFINNYTFSSDSATRTWKYQMISDKISNNANAKALHLRFGAYDATLPLTVNPALIYSDSVNSVNFIANGVAGTYFVGNASGSKVTRLPYLRNASDPTQIEVIQSAVVVNSSNEMIANPASIWDSTYNSAVGFPLTIGSDRCCYLDNYTVMKC